MANEKETSNKNSGSSATPFVIIGLIVLVTIVGIWWISQSGDKADGTNQNSSNTTTTDQTQQAVSNYAKAPAGASPETFKGSPNALVVLEEFADFQCAACAAAHPVFNEIVSAYGSKIKFVFRNFPLIQTHPKAYDAAVAVEAAGFQGKFWEMQNLLFANQQKWSTVTDHRKTFEEYAKTIGLDVDKFTTDSLGLNAKTRVDADMRRGIAINLSSTPSLYVNGKPVPFEQMTVAGIKAVVDAELERVEPKSDDAKSGDSDTEKGDDSEVKKDDQKDEKPADDSADSEEKKDSK